MHSQNVAKPFAAVMVAASVISALLANYETMIATAFLAAIAANNS